MMAVTAFHLFKGHKNNEIWKADILTGKTIGDPWDFKKVSNRENKGYASQP